MSPALAAHLRLLQSDLPRRTHERQFMDDRNRRGGMRNFNRRLWQRMAQQVVELREAGKTLVEICNELDVSKPYVVNVLKKRTAA